MDVYNDADEKRSMVETVLFFTVTYGVCWIVGFFNYYKGFMSGHTMAIFMMTLPATGVSVAKLYKNAYSSVHLAMHAPYGAGGLPSDKVYPSGHPAMHAPYGAGGLSSDQVRNDENRRVHFVYVGCFLCLMCLIFLRIAGIISKALLEVFINEILISAVSLLVFIFSWLGQGELDPGKNWKKVRWELLLFMVLLIAGGAISSIGAKFVDFYSITAILSNYMFCLLQGALFFGEEYGWRGFLQEKMQRRFGKRFGVILLGIMWELWHLPIWFSVYHVDGLGLILRFLSTGSIAVMIGYVYMKSNNVWVCAFMHYSINLFAIAFPGDAGSYQTNAAHITAPKIVEIVVLFLVFSSFLCTKEYGKRDGRVRLADSSNIRD